MASTRCTCIYRPTGRADHGSGAPWTFTVHVSDPWCPATAVHARVAERAAAAGSDSAR